jgi:dynein heavy chain
MSLLFEYDKDHIKPKIVKALTKYVDNPEYTPEHVARQSKAAMSLCMWTRAMHTYSRVAKVVKPKRAALKAAEDALADTMAQLRAAQDKLRSVKDNVAALEQQLTQAMDDQQSLKDLAELTVRRLARAEKLTSGLADEQVRFVFPKSRHSVYRP